MTAAANNPTTASMRGFLRGLTTAWSIRLSGLSLGVFLVAVGTLLGVPLVLPQLDPKEWAFPVVMLVVVSPSLAAMAVLAGVVSVVRRRSGTAWTGLGVSLVLLVVLAFMVLRPTGI